MGSIKNRINEPNIIIAINSCRKVIDIFKGPFLTAYFIQTSKDSLKDLSIYYILAFFLLGVTSYVVAAIIKNKFSIGMFRIGVVLNFFYIMSIIILQERIIDHIFLIAILLGVSGGCYWFPYNLFMLRKVKNTERTKFNVNSKIVISIIGILCPVLLGSIITATDFILTATIVLVISIIQIILSFLISPEGKGSLPGFNLSSTFKALRTSKELRVMVYVEFFIGMNVSDGALEVLKTVLIFNSFKTSLNLGIITSITTILTMIAAKIYGKVYSKRDDKNLILVSGILPVVAVGILIFWKNSFTIIIYNLLYVIFTDLLAMTREIRLFNISNSQIINKENQCEFFAFREGILNLGRMAGYAILIIAAIFSDEIIMNIILIILTMSIFVMGLLLRRIGKHDTEENMQVNSDKPSEV